MGVRINPTVQFQPSNTCQQVQDARYMKLPFMGSWKSSWNSQKQLPPSLFRKRLVWCNWWPTDWSIHFPASDRWYLCQLFARWPASTLRVYSSTNTTTDLLPAWWSTAPFQSGRKAVSESSIPKSMDWSWLCTELATAVTESEPIRLPCVGLRESYGVCTQGEHERRTPATNS